MRLSSNRTRVDGQKVHTILEGLDKRCTKKFTHAGVFGPKCAQSRSDDAPNDDEPCWKFAEWLFKHRRIVCALKSGPLGRSPRGWKTPGCLGLQFWEFRRLRMDRFDMLTSSQYNDHRSESSLSLIHNYLKESNRGRTKPKTHL